MNRRIEVIFRLVCVRHGKTETNIKMRIQGHIDAPLCETGRKQSEKTGYLLNGIAFSRAYSSDLLRAISTCKCINKQNIMSTATIKMDARLRERNFGCVEGMLLTEYYEMAKNAGMCWSNYCPPGAESMTEVHLRIVEFFKELCQSVYDRSVNKGNTIDVSIDQQLTENILIVSHGLVLRELYIHLAKILNGVGFPGDVESLSNIAPHTSISEFIVRYSLSNYQIHCVRFNDVNHLNNF